MWVYFEAFWIIWTRTRADSNLESISLDSTTTLWWTLGEFYFEIEISWQYCLLTNTQWHHYRRRHRVSYYSL